mmetsp:Transcript_25086/g.98958  ORF Transcript_25086/g.98958 Transcript_25086/m.98958 type:complete len:94 (+) Transcript_25086:191-472(+)
MANLSQNQIDQLYLAMVICGGGSFVFSFVVLLAHVFLRKSQRRFNDPVLWLRYANYRAGFSVVRLLTPNRETLELTSLLCVCQLFSPREAVAV